MAVVSFTLPLGGRARHLAAVTLVGLAAFSAGCGQNPVAPTPPPMVTPPVVIPPQVNNPPTVACPAPISVNATTNAAATVTFATPSAEGGQPPVTVECSPASGTAFPIGTTSVQCVAKDALERTASCAFPVTVVAPPQLRRTRFLAFGDSITAGEVTVPTTGVSPAGQPLFKLVQVLSAAYPTVLLDLLKSRYATQAQDVVVSNQGLGGEKAEFALSRFISVFTSTGPDVVLLMEGYNDICCGNGSVGINAGARGLNDMAAEARNRRARVFIATLAPSKPGGSRSTPIETVQAFNARVRAIAASEGAYLVAVYGALLPDVNVTIGIDGLHPTEIGYRRIAEAFFAAIQADLEMRP